MTARKPKLIGRNGEYQEQPLQATRVVYTLLGSAKPEGRPLCQLIGVAYDNPNDGTTKIVLNATPLTREIYLTDIITTNQRTLH